MRRSAFILILIVASCSTAPAHVTGGFADFPDEQAEVEKVLHDIMVAAVADAGKILAVGSAKAVPL
jgi:hypothetical protein